MEEGIDAAALVGREREIGRLFALLDGVQERGVTRLLVGEPGIGKSSLLSAAAARGRELGFRVLTASGVQSEARLPFAALHQLLRPVLDGLDGLPRPQREALRTAFGVIEGTSPDPFLIGLAALHLLAATAESGPLLILNDDVQWMDRPTRDVLAFVARRTAGEPIVMVGAIRSGPDDEFIPTAAPEWVVPGLDAGAARRLLHRTAPGLARSARERVTAAAEGNPLALLELSAAGRAEAPGSPVPVSARLERAFGGRSSSCPPRRRRRCSSRPSRPATRSARSSGRPRAWSVPGWPSRSSPRRRRRDW